ncbi:MAG: DUF3794 domain-containing protein [Candidatus Faecivicinus sp.]
MALETMKQTIEVEALIGAQYSQVLIRAEALVPGAGREAIEPLMAEANVSVSGADVQNERVVLDGTAYCQAVYRQGAEATLRALTAQASLSQVVEISGAAPGMLPRVLAQVEHVEAKYENGHMVFLVTCGLRAQVLQLKQTEVIDSISGVDGLQTVYADVCSFKLAADTDADVLVKGEIALPVALDARTSLMDWGAVCIDSAEPDLGGLRVKGRVMMETLISSGVTGRPAALIKYPLAFDRLVELPEWLLKDAFASAAIKRIQSQVEQSEGGEDAKLQVDVELCIAVQANARDCVSALQDVYTTEGNALEVVRGSIDVCSAIDRVQFSESVRGAVLLGENAPGVGTVVAVRVRPDVGEWRNENGKGRIEGLLEATVLYMPGGSDLPAAAQAELPFAIDVPSELSDESWIALEVVSAEANALMSDRLEMKTMLNVCCETRRRSDATIVRDVTEGEPIRRRSGIVILWPNEGETAWDIGRRYALSVDRVTGEGEKKRRIEAGKPIVLKL